MTRDLTARRREPASGQTKSILVFLHGYGTNGQDLLGLADPMAEYLPDTLFVAPDAPDPCPGNPGGRQWFPVPEFDGASPEVVGSAFLRSAADLDGFLDTLLETEGIAPGRLALLGFSQGAMLALHVAPRRAEALAGVVSCSGRMVRPERLAEEARSRPPVLLLHGDADPVMPFASMEEAGQILVSLGCETYAHVEHGAAHEITPDGLGAAVSFLEARLRG